MNPKVWRAPIRNRLPLNGYCRHVDAIAGKRNDNRNQFDWKWINIPNSFDPHSKYKGPRFLNLKVQWTVETAMIERRANTISFTRFFMWKTTWRPSNCRTTRQKAITSKPTYAEIPSSNSCVGISCVDLISPFLLSSFLSRHSPVSRC